MSDVHLSRSGPPETVLDPEPPDAVSALAEALTLGGEARRDALARVVSQWPRCLEAWSRLADHGRDEVESYAYYRVGYHRGLDRLRQSGWRGTGYVRWVHPENTGFLRSLDGLRHAAGAIGETDEAQRCAQFLAQLDPTGGPT